MFISTAPNLAVSAGTELGLEAFLSSFLMAFLAAYGSHTRVVDRERCVRNPWDKNSCHRQYLLSISKC